MRDAGGAARLDAESADRSAAAVQHDCQLPARELRDAEEEGGLPEEHLRTARIPDAQDPDRPPEEPEGKAHPRHVNIN